MIVPLSVKNSFNSSSSKKSETEAAGLKGPEARWSSLRTFYAYNANLNTYMILQFITV